MFQSRCNGWLPPQAYECRRRKFKWAPLQKGNFMQIRRANMPQSWSSTSRPRGGRFGMAHHSLNSTPPYLFTPPATDKQHSSSSCSQLPRNVKERTQLFNVTAEYVARFPFPFTSATAARLHTSSCWAHINCSCGRHFNCSLLCDPRLLPLLKWVLS